MELLYRGYLISPSCHFYPDLNRWGVRFFVRKDNLDNTVLVPFDVSDMDCDSEEEAQRHSLAAARQRVDRHLDDQDGSLDGLD